MAMVYMVARVNLATREKEREKYMTKYMTKTVQKIRGRMEAYCCKVFTLLIKLFNINRRRTVIN